MGNYVHEGYPEKTESCFYLRKFKNCQKIIMEFRVKKFVKSFISGFFRILRVQKLIAQIYLYLLFWNGDNRDFKT